MHRKEMKKFLLFHSHLQFANLECPMNDLQDPLVFLDTQVSLAPTHVSKLVGPLVRPSHFRISNLWSVMVAQIKKFKKKSFYF